MNLNFNFNNVGDKLIEKIAGAVEVLYDPNGDKMAYRDFQQLSYRILVKTKNSHMKKESVLHKNVVSY